MLAVWGAIFAIAISTVRAADNDKAETDFPVSYWCGPPADFTTSERYEQIRNAGFTFVMPPCGGTDLKLNKKILDFCAEEGLKAIIADPRMPLAVGGNPDAIARLNAIIKDYSSHPALWGYFICDEPGTGAFAGLGEVVQYLREHDPSHVALINMLPNYADASVYGGKSYEAWLRSYVETVHPFVLSYDHYHFLNDGTDRPGFKENLTAARKVSLERRIHFWQIVLCVEHGGYRNLTEGELRYEAMQTLVNGGKGLLWFTYWSPGASDKTFEWKHAMVNPDGTTDPHFDAVRKINYEVRALGSQLMKAESTQVVPPTKQTPYTLGIFKGAGNSRLALVANESYQQASDAPVTIANADKVEQYDPNRKQWMPLTGKNADGKFSLTIHLSAGGAALIRW